MHVYYIEYQTACDQAKCSCRNEVAKQQLLHSSHNDDNATVLINLAYLMEIIGKTLNWRATSMAEDH